jgi:hypothetical protein
LISFTTPQQVDTITNEKWRVLSKPIVRNGQTLGVILVAEFNPQNPLIEEIDSKLKETVDTIDRSITYKNNKMDVSHLDIRHLPYDMTFEITDKYNKVILNHGRTPSYIDPSYVNDQFNKNGISTYVDKRANEMYVLSSKTLYDNNNPIGVIVIGRSVKDITSVLQLYLLFSCVAGLVLSIPFSMTVYHFMERNKGFFFVPQKSDQKQVFQQDPKAISFDTSTSILRVDDRSVELVPGTNQYELTSALFEAPERKWDQDILLKRFNEEVTEDNWRKVYDALLAINKKTGIKLVLYKNKTYMMNPEYIRFIKK